MFFHTGIWLLGSQVFRFHDQLLGKKLVERETQSSNFNVAAPFSTCSEPFSLHVINDTVFSPLAVFSVSLKSHTDSIVQFLHMLFWCMCKVSRGVICRWCVTCAVICRYGLTVLMTTNTPLHACVSDL